MKKFALPALTALMLSGGSLHAATYALEYQDPDDVFGSEGLYSSVTIDSEVYDGTFRAGQFALSKNGLSDIWAFCVEVTQAIVNGDDNYTNTPDLFDVAILDNIDKLFSSAFDSVTDNLTAGAFQVALWEIVEDTSTGIDLSSGTFIATDASTDEGSIVGTAQSFLDGLASAPMGLFELEFMASPTSQDLVSAQRAPAPVPVPATGLLLLSAGGLLLVRRKKA